MNKKQLVYYVVLTALISCGKYVPVERREVGSDSDFPTRFFSPTLGRTTVMVDLFRKKSTTYPADFELVNIRRKNGSAAPEFADVFPVTVWTKAYTGLETSLAEIEAKRTTEYHRLLEVMPHSGEIVLWAPARSSFVRSYPDSGYVFDIKVSNSGGAKYYKNFRLMPYRERAFEPSNLDISTGMPVRLGLNPSRANDMVGKYTGRSFSSTGINVYIRRLMGPNEPTNKLTFRFLDKDDQFINPDKFADTDWKNLIHGFNMVKNETGVSFDVAYPMPAAKLSTKYTTADGGFASVNFLYHRLGFASQVENAVLGLEFAIYEPGNWEIVFKFLKDNPKFENG